MVKNTQKTLNVDWNTIVFDVDQYSNIIINGERNKIFLCYYEICPSITINGDENNICFYQYQAVKDFCDNKKIECDYLYNDFLCRLIYNGDRNVLHLHNYLDPTYNGKIKKPIVYYLKSFIDDGMNNHIIYDISIKTLSIPTLTNVYWFEIFNRWYNNYGNEIEKKIITYPEYYEDQFEPHFVKKPIQLDVPSLPKAKIISNISIKNDNNPGITLYNPTQTFVLKPGVIENWHYTNFSYDELIKLANVNTSNLKYFMNDFNDLESEAKEIEIIYKINTISGIEYDGWVVKFNDGNYTDLSKNDCEILKIPYQKHLKLFPNNNFFVSRKQNGGLDSLNNKSC
jgi:hypothetical protein